MKSSKILGILMLLIYVCVATALLNDSFIKPYNLQNLLRSSSMFAIIGIGATMVIVTGGISLATGSLIGLVGCTMTMVLRSWMQHPPGENGSYVFWMIGLELLIGVIAWIAWDSALKRRGAFETNARSKAIGLISGAVFVAISFWMKGAEFGPWLTMASAVVVALYLSVHLGLLHGLLITKLKLQPFVVTLCGLMAYRGISRYLTGDQTQGLGTDFNDSLRLLAIGKPCTVTFVFLMFSTAAIVYGLWKLVFKPAGLSEAKKKETNVWALVTIGIGGLLATIASSRYWDGWSEFVKTGETFANIAGNELKFFTLDLPQSAIDRPAVLMSYALYPMIVAFLALILVSGKSAFRSALSSSAGAELTKRLVWWAMPLITVLVSLSGILAMKYWVGDEAVSLTKLDTAFSWNAVEGTEDIFRWGINEIMLKLGGVFLCMAALTGGVMWMGKSWTRGSEQAPQILVVVVGILSILWLLSKTAIHETIVQTPFFILLVIGVIASVFLNKTVYGRYLLALGNNREAAKYSGINTDNMLILAYTLCALCGGIGAVLFTLDSNNVEPSGHGSFYELYAIAAAVLGGCSLRGGEGSILGVIIGASIMRVLYNAPDMIGVASQLEMFTIGIVLLIGVIVDETAKRFAAKQDRNVAS